MKNKRNVLIILFFSIFIATSPYAQNSKAKNNNNNQQKSNSTSDLINEKNKANYASCVVELKKQIKIFESCLNAPIDDIEVIAATLQNDIPRREFDKEFICSFENNSPSKEGKNYHKVGIFEFSTPPTLNSDQASINVAIDVLKSEEDSYGRPSFAFNIPGGGLVFGLWIQEDDGDLVTAREIMSWLPQPFPDEWQIKNLNGFAERKYNKYGYSYVSIAAEGMGDGKFFAVKSSRPTLAIWYHIPVYYKDNNKFKMGRLKLYARTASECKKSTEDLLQEILMKLEPYPNFTLISESNYIQNLPAKQPPNGKSGTSPKK